MTMQQVLHPRDHINKWYMLRREEEERALTSIKDCVDVSSLDFYIKKRKERLLTATSNRNIKTIKLDNRIFIIQVS